MNLRRVWIAAVVLLSGAVGLGAYTQATAADAKKLSTEERLRHLEDVESIRSLLVAYGRTFDRRDFAAYAGLFAQDGVWIGGAENTQTYTGPEAIRTFVEKIYPPTVFPGGYHIMSNFDIEIDGVDTAKAWSRWTFVVRGVHNEPVIFHGGYYEDAFVREKGIWKFKSRRVLSDPPNK